MVPERPPKSKTRYESETDGANCVRVAVPPTAVPVDPREPPELSVPPTPVMELPPAELDVRARFTDPFTLGKSAPRAAPYWSTAARASAQDSRVAGLLRSARSTTSVIDNCAPRVASAESARNAVVAGVASGGAAGGAGVRAASGTGQGVAGSAGAPGRPSMRGIPGEHASRHIRQKSHIGHVGHITAPAAHHCRAR